MKTNSPLFKGLFLIGLTCTLFSAAKGLSAPLELSATGGNGTLVVSWPAEYIGYYYLQRAPGLDGPWIAVATSFPTNRMSLPIAIPAYYYRLAALSTADPHVPRNGLVAEYPFNSTPVDTAIYQGVHRDGLIQGGVSPTTNRFGTPGCAWQFDGLTGSIQVSDEDVFSVSTTGEFSIAGWMRSDTDTCPKSDGGGHWVYWLSKLEYGNDCDANNGSQDEWGFRKYNLDSGESEPGPGTCGADFPGGRPDWVSIYLFNLCSAGINYGAGSRTECSPALVGKWNFYAATFKHTGSAPTYGTIQLFKNGLKIDSDSFVYNGSGGTVIINPGNGTAPVRFGKGSGEYYFQGAIDNVRFYNRVLSDQEVLDLFHDQTQ